VATVALLDIVELADLLANPTDAVVMNACTALACHIDAELL
jgi:hypothetical protein